MNSPRLFGTNGIRGIVNEFLTPEFVTTVGMAIGSELGHGKTVLVGYDVRVSNIMLLNALVAGLCSCGVHVVNCGLVTTPELQYAVKKKQEDWGVAITASHNPPEYNGVKVIGSNGIEIPRETEEQIEERIKDRNFILVDWNKVGLVEHVDLGLLYQEGVIKVVSENKNAIRQMKLRVVIDGANSVGGVTTARVLQALGCQVISVNGHLDGTFPGRNPEPTLTNLKDLMETVTAVGADFGVAHDGDGDRAIFVDEKGQVLLGDQSFAVILKEQLRRKKGGVVVTPVSSSNLIQEVVEKAGGRIIWTVVGSTIVSKEMINQSALIGGEENGGVFLMEHQPVRDGTMTAALIAELISIKRKSLSQLVEELPKYVVLKEGVPCANEKKERVLNHVKANTEQLQKITIDGVKLLFPNASVLIRPSGTEAKFRCFVEAKTTKRAKELLNWSLDLLTNGIEKSK